MFARDISTPSSRITLLIKAHLQLTTLLNHQTWTGTGVVEVKEWTFCPERVWKFIPTFIIVREARLSLGWRKSWSNAVCNSYRLQTGLSRDRIPVEARFSTHVQTGPGSPPTSCARSTRCQAPGWNNRCVWECLHSPSGTSWPVSRVNFTVYTGGL